MLIQQTYKGSLYPLTPKYIISEIKWFQPVGRVGQYREALPKSGIQVYKLIGVLKLW